MCISGYMPLMHLGPNHKHRYRNARLCRSKPLHKRSYSMPTRSRAQFRLMKGIEEGSIKPKGKLTPSVAAEMTAGQSQAGLPERSRKQAVWRRDWRFR